MTQPSRMLAASLPTVARRRALGLLAAAALVSGLAVSPQFTPSAQAADGASCSSLPNGTCPAGSIPITGDHAHVQAIPRGVQTAFGFWRQIQWPNFRNIAGRGYVVNVGNVYNTRTHQEDHQYIESGGQYADNGGNLTNFLHAGRGTAEGRNYRGAFQEYYGSVYPSDPVRTGIRTGNFRIVRALGTGDTWVSIDHYSTFRYVGRR